MNKIKIQGVFKKINKGIKKIMSMVIPTVFLLSNEVFAANNAILATATTPKFFTGTGLLLAALLTAVLGLIGAYVTLQVVGEWFRYVDAEPEERKLHMKGIKSKAIGGIGAVCTSGVIGWMLAFY